MKRLEGRIAVVTGAASGMGQGIATKLAEQGACVELLDRESVDATMDLIQASGGTSYAHRCDVTDELAIDASVERVTSRHSHIDILVNNAGIVSGGLPWHEHRREDLERYLQINCVGYFLIAKAFYALLRKSQAGRLINVASRTYFMGNPGQLAYVASKGAVMGMTKVLARELGAENITVNAVAPGMVATPGVNEFFTDEALDRVMLNQSIKKRGTPRHLADLVAFLAGDEAELITGQTILCDGGGYML